MSVTDSAVAYAKKVLSEAGVTTSKVDDRMFPDERWLIIYVPDGSLIAAQSTAGAIETALNSEGRASSHGGPPWVVAFRPTPPTEPATAPLGRGRLATAQVDQLIQLLEARSRTSDALPSLKYVEDPRASLAAIGASRHQLIYGRRGVGKTALLLEAKRNAQDHGGVAVWFNAHVVRQLPAATAFGVIAERIFDTLASHGGSSIGASFARIQQERDALGDLRKAGRLTDAVIAEKLPDLNKALRAVLHDGLVRMFIYVDDFYLLPATLQPAVLDYLAGMLRDCDGWLKVASIERLTRPFEPSNKVGLEVPHDASIIDLDVTLEDPEAAQRFLEAVLANYTQSVGIRKPSRIAKSQALGRLVLASGGVPRDYLNLFAASIVVARRDRSLAREVGKEDVARAAGEAAQSKKRDLEQDVSTDSAGRLLTALNQVSRYVKGRKHTYFLINIVQKTLPNYEVLGQLVDLRFAHLVQPTLSDQHRPGLKYEAYVLDLSEFTGVRLQRGLNVLDLEAGKWNWRLTGNARTKERLTSTQLRDRLRVAPVVDLQDLASLGT